MIELLIINSFLCFGIRAATAQGFLLHPVAVAFDEASRFAGMHIHVKLEDFIDWILKPVLNCVRCMASFWGLLVLWMFREKFGLYFPMISPETVLYIVALLGFNSIFAAIIESIENPF
jgi:hypothetical protein